MSESSALAEPTFGEEEVEAVRVCLESGWVTGQGPRGAALEAAIARQCACRSGGAAGGWVWSAVPATSEPSAR
jgi:dTDP-4-amino-4,6-dideoxygalactose transaminase